MSYTLQHTGWRNEEFEKKNLTCKAKSGKSISTVWTDFTVYGSENSYLVGCMCAYIYIYIYIYKKF